MREYALLHLVVAEILNSRMLILLEEGVDVDVELIVQLMILHRVYHCFSVRRVRLLALCQKALEEVDLLLVLRKLISVLVDFREASAVLVQSKHRGLSNQSFKVGSLFAFASRENLELTGLHKVGVLG